ncbi:uncharacterized protein METZ01_LOCUS117436 [marine metagenome]|jgi:hypothetical protein|uniref:Uncharacterized protein n=1 Tax=marine metagenome TaxID=408172 RepID=A0A381XJA1_9ZZZZ
MPEFPVISGLSGILTDLLDNIVVTG